MARKLQIIIIGSVLDHSKTTEKQAAPGDAKVMSFHANIEVTLHNLDIQQKHYTTMVCNELE